ncbi:MAG: phosphoenolpyruvate--protein phosphotransferase [Planctomycetota bacterium]|nr:MAG: phosphoenolpyruvate--protein phosphotransferase [Planctomycetota bacterium]
MRIVKGIPVVDGIVIARSFVLQDESYLLPPQVAVEPSPEWVQGEWERFQRAVESAKAEVRQVADELAQQAPLGEAATDVTRIMGFQAGLYEDPTFAEAVREQIEAGIAPEHAVSKRVATYRKQFELDPFTRRLLPDLEEFERRLLRHLLGEQRISLRDLKEPVVLIARDLTPQQAAELPPEWVLGFATDLGGKTSHTAILAQSLHIPAVVGLGHITGVVTGGELVILDGRQGKVVIDPDEVTLRSYEQRRERYSVLQRALEELVALPAETLDGHQVRLFANIEYPEEIQQALRVGAEGIGLYRTEFLYDERNPDPSEEDHYAAYSRAIELLGDRPLVIRTLDLGADKFVPEGLDHEPNPFLGCRSIRYCLLEREDVFIRQLRAILRASVRGDVRIMLPMISSLEELQAAKAVIEEVKGELRRSGHAIREDIPVGIMIEVPAAALMADVLARYADFFSIGTNDLVQYVLAVDRVNPKVQDLYQPAHPAVFRLILSTIAAARRHKIPVSICGELSGDPHFTLPLLGLGMRDLSMAPSLIPKIKRFIRSITAVDAGKAVDTMLGLHDATETLEYLDARAREIDPAFFL